MADLQTKDAQSKQWTKEKTKKKHDKNTTKHCRRGELKEPIEQEERLLPGQNQKTTRNHSKLFCLLSSFVSLFNSCMHTDTHTNTHTTGRSVLLSRGTHSTWVAGRTFAAFSTKYSMMSSFVFIQTTLTDSHFDSNCVCVSVCSWGQLNGSRIEFPVKPIRFTLLFAATVR